MRLCHNDRVTRRWIARTALLLTAAIVVLVPAPRAWVEQVYVHRIYARLQPAFTAIGNVMPFAIFDLLLILCLTWILTRWLWRRREQRLLGHRTTWIGGAGVLLVDIVLLAAALLVWFELTWGLNYQRIPLRQRVDYADDRITAAQVTAMTFHAVREMNRLHAEASRAPWPSWHDLPATLGPAFVRAQRSLATGWDARPGSPKWTMLDFYFRLASVDGMTNPFALEVLVNNGVEPFERPFITAHEWGHLAGAAHEAEASFLGWLTCLHGDAQAQYSAWLAMYGHLAASAPRSIYPALNAALEPGPRRDLTAIARRVRSQAMPEIRTFAWTTYDRFLKANRVSEGIVSYDGVTKLVVGTHVPGVWPPAALASAPADPPVDEPRK